MTIDDNRKLNIIMDYPATSLLKLECSQDGGVTWTEYGPTIAIGNTNFSENYYHPLTGAQYRLNILEDDTYIYQFRVVDTRYS